MKAKNILKTLALPVAVALGMMATSCSSDDNIIDSEKSANTKGYALPVTVNVSRQGDEGTRATYTDTGNGTGSLAFSAGDKLFVQADNSPAGKFAGLLEWQSGGTFSGTIMTQNAYSGTADALLAATSYPFAALVPAGYGNYNFFTINGEGTYNASLVQDYSKAFALTKKEAVEQFSFEYASSYSSGFTLEPNNAIINFTISGLAANTAVAVSFHDIQDNTSSSVTTDASGVATFAVGMPGYSYLQYYSLTVDGNDIAMPTKTVEPGHIYNITRVANAINGKFTINAGGDQVYFSKGNLRYNGSTWSFFDNQFDYYTTHDGTNWDKFGWSTLATNYGMSTSESNSTYSGDFVDWGTNSSLQSQLGTGWRTLTGGSGGEWEYVFNTRTTGGTVFDTENARYTEATINTDGTGVNGIILFPDGVDIAGSEVTTAGTVNVSSAWGTKCTTAQWSALEAKGCVFLPAAGYRIGNIAQSFVNFSGEYRSSTASGENHAYFVIFNSGGVNPADYYDRREGFSVRLVRQVE